MELKGKHVYSAGALVAGVVALATAAVYWMISQKVDATIQAGIAIGLIGFAIFAWLEMGLITGFLKSRQARFGAESLAFILLFLVMVGLINYLFGNYEKLKFEADVTESKENSLTPETLKVLGEIKEPVEVLGFYTQTHYGRGTGEQLLQRFRDKSDGKVTYKMVDLQTEPLLAREYGITNDGTLVATRGEQREQAKSADESGLINAIVRLENPVAQTIYFIVGHGEYSPEQSGEKGLSQTKTYLEGVNYQIKILASLASPIPADASAVVIAGPTKVYTQAEVDTLDKYLAGGGKAIFMIETPALYEIPEGQTDTLVDYLGKNWGITLNNDFVLDTSQNMGNAGYPATIAYAQGPLITPDMQQVASFFPSARSITVNSGAAPANLSVTSVVKTSPAAWGETDFEALKQGQISLDEGETQGDLTLVATAENLTTRARVVVFGDAEFALDGFWSSGAANPILLLNSVKWLTAREDSISLPPPNTVDRSMTVTSRDVVVIGLLSCVLPPLLVIVGGVAVWWTRRRNE